MLQVFSPGVPGELVIYSLPCVEHRLRRLAPLSPSRLLTCPKTTTPLAGPTPPPSPSPRSLLPTTAAPLCTSSTPSWGSNCFARSTTGNLPVCCVLRNPFLTCRPAGSLNAPRSRPPWPSRMASANVSTSCGSAPLALLPPSPRSPATRPSPQANRASCRPSSGPQTMCAPTSSADSPRMPASSPRGAPRGIPSASRRLRCRIH